ncbi:MAG TPA: OB-fold domain-containing protein [Mycobacteriales bacterium]|jgi:3-hydroxy-3-methylglutaryl CoA synthase/uncharacterized OB-fold protein|nr:OB-fold domain-containing protein [Mycobacteriales bacterium]
MTGFGLVAYATYLPHFRLSREEIGTALGTSAGRGERVVAGFDEDATTMAVEAARRARGSDIEQNVSAIYFATTSPPYLDKTNAAAIHAALGLSSDGFAADLAGSARSGTAALRAAMAGGGLAVLADIRLGLPGSGDERGGGDGAAALVFGDPGESIADVLSAVSLTAEVLDRWRGPERLDAEVWEERFGLETYEPLITQAARRALEAAGLDGVDHAVVTSPNAGVAKRARALLPQAAELSSAPIGHCGAADVGIAIAAILDHANAGETILVVSAVDGCDALVLRTTGRLAARRQACPVAEQLATGAKVSYPSYLTWRSQLVREAPRRPEPERPAGPPSARGEQWKFGLIGSRCTSCGTVHLPPERACKGCGAVDAMAAHSVANHLGTIATYTVDRLAFSPSPPLVSAVVDFDGGGRCALEVADADPERLAVGARVDVTFRRLFTAGGVHNYFWKARLV